jgi:hypothetical protein
MIFKKGKDVFHAETKNGKVIATIRVNGHFVSNPTLQQLENDGWTKVIPTQQEDTPTYKDRVVGLIRKEYDVDDELSILRQRDTKPEEFEKYNTYIEWCKKEAKKEGKKKKSGE